MGDWADKVFVTEWKREEDFQRRSDVPPRRLWLLVADEDQLAKSATADMHARGFECQHLASPERLADRSADRTDLGSIGLSALKLLLEELGGPREIVLCDPSASMERIWNEIGAYREVLEDMPVRTIRADTPTESVLQATLIVGASSTPNILDVDAIRSGTIVVDDSFPHCFDEQQAIGRMKDKGGVVITCGGLLTCESTKRWLMLPVPEMVKKQIAAAVPEFGLASCHLEGVLMARSPDMPPAIGLVDIANARAMAKAMPTGIEAAPCHVGTFKVPDTCMETCRRGGTITSARAQV